ncbi:uncharacterized protein LOC126748600 [Anthonomus grandis grandis]|uniref:uncharacterized protein LOC126748600 n=1 Tax=Anthonomus grandis grandis TaxID=2921223 RepID=UPI00216556B1|nr:uncharacterized protein LOC126748600 [Anthonomus grandis grandis]
MRNLPLHPWILMTSTSFNIGLTTDKNSSRVLRPPGGSHSDIFGLRDVQNEIATPSKKRVTPQSTIGGCFQMADEVDKAKCAKEELEPAKGEQVEDPQKRTDNGIDENKAPKQEELKTEQEIPKMKKLEDPIPVSKRGRVPPGGFSSGLCMISANRNIDLTRKSSIKVFPSGRSADFFAIRNKELIPRKKKVDNAPQSTIADCFQMEDKRSEPKQVKK